MAEPVNTPMPASTPVPASTPRSTSPAPPLPHLSPNATMSAITRMFPPATAERAAPKRPVVLHIGDPIKYNPATYAEFSAEFEVIHPSAAERERAEFIRALKERRWGDFSAIFRPFWGTGGEMGRWDAELISLLPDTVKVFASAGAGFDWVDTELLGEKGIIYCNSGLAAAEAVADFAVAMIISTFRHLPWCMTAATFPPPTPLSTDPAHTEARAQEAFQTCHARATAASHNPRGHVLGLIGFGNIGQQIAAKLGNPAFGMRIAYHDVVRKPPGLETSLHATFHPTLSSLLQAADCVVLATPASPDGRPLITASTLAQFRPGARFVNVARGSLVDEAALADALESGHLAAAALDVHANEPRVHPRLVRLASSLPVFGGGGGGGGGGGEGSDTPAVPGAGRVMLTCHNAGGTVETHVGFEELSMRNILAVLRGGEAVTAVNLGSLKKR